MTIPNELLSQFKGWRTFTLADAVRFLKVRHKISRATTQVTLSRMVKSGRIYRVMKGVYSTSNSVESAGFAFSPFYYGGLSALMIRDLIDDQVKMEVMTTKKVRRSNFKVFGNAGLILHNIPDRCYFGFNEVHYANGVVPVSDPEKTLIDMLYFKIRLSAQDYNPLVGAIDKAKLASYLKKYNVRFAQRVMRFFNSMGRKARAGVLESGY